jgi:Lysylphosphatidylglycerol synthase TM region
MFLTLALRASRSPGDGGSLASRALRATAGASATTLRALQRPGWQLAIGAPAFLLCDIAVLWVTIHAVGYDVPVAPLLLAYLIGYLANAVPIPGGVGVLDGGLAAALLLYHVPAPAAVGGVLLYHALALWIPALSGTIGFIGAQREIKYRGVHAGARPGTDKAALRAFTTEGEPGSCAGRRSETPSPAAYGGPEAAFI